jgi:hypothetical protein
VLSAKGTGIDVMVTKGSFEADVEDCVVGDVGVLRCSKCHCCFFEGAVEGREEISGFIENTCKLTTVKIRAIPITQVSVVCAKFVEGDD